MSIAEKMLTINSSKNWAWFHENFKDYNFNICLLFIFGVVFTPDRSILTFCGHHDNYFVSDSLNPPTHHFPFWTRVGNPPTQPPHGSVPESLLFIHTHTHTVQNPHRGSIWTGTRFALPPSLSPTLHLIFLPPSLILHGLMQYSLKYR